MKKLDMHSPDLVAKNIDALAELFPNCLTEAADENGKLVRRIDFDLLRQELEGGLVEGPAERFRLDWPGKRQALLTANAPIAKTLRPDREASVNFDSTRNIYIEGDNLEALKLLQENYLGKVKMIYIDPPYNTGHDFIYEDDFTECEEEFLVNSDIKDEDGNRLRSWENTEANGRFHSDWLSMMYPRLKQARNLLRDDGFIFISIDDGEVHHVRMLLDEIMGANNFVDCIIWKKRYGGGAKEKHLVSLHEYVLVYAKNIEMIGEIFVPLSEDSIKRYYTQKDSNYERRGPYRTHPLEATKSMGDRPNLVFPVPAPDGSIIYPKRQWLWSKERVEAAISANELEFIQTNDGKWTIHSKQYLKDDNGEVRPGKAFSIIDDVYTQHGTNEILKYFGNTHIFSFPKPSSLLGKLLEIGTSSDSLVLDFFSGSATTANAVMNLNSQDGGSRRFIMIQLPEAVDEKAEAFKAGYKTIADIGRERIRRAGQEILNKISSGIGFDDGSGFGMGSVGGAGYGDGSGDDGHPLLDIGFRAFKIDSSNMLGVYYTPDNTAQDKLAELVDNIKPGRTDEDLLFQVLLDWGLDLALPLEQKNIAGNAVFAVDGNALAACFDDRVSEELVTELARRKPPFLRVVFRDSSFHSDSDKINVAQIFKQLSPSTEVKVI